MPSFSGINHVALTVRDLDVSERFYCDVLGFFMVLDIGYGRLCIDRRSGFTIALLKLDDAVGDRFDHRQTGLDHLGLAAASRDELLEWEQRFQAADVSFSPIQDKPLGYHLNFTDPDDIALEFQAPNAAFGAVLAELDSATLTEDEMRARAAEMLL